MTATRWFLFIILLMIFLYGCDEAVQDTQTPLQGNLSEAQATPGQAQDQAAGQCPASCDDDDRCTEDYCSNSTGFACTHDTIVPCCGNNICEENENHSSCAADCPECTAGKCEKAEFDHDKQKCINVTVSPCCGNDMCERNETYESCSEDCPECTTDEKCKKSLFDYDSNSCVTKRQVPCCGNGICDVSESCSSCEEDCECNDDVDLVRYPGFLHDGTLIVVGDKATSRDVVTATGMITKLEVAGIDADSDLLSLISPAKLSSNDIIALGGPCDNQLWDTYLGVECDKDYIKEDRAIIKLIIQNKRDILFIGGHTPVDTQKAAEALTGGKISFSSTEVELDTSGSSAKAI